MKEHPILFSSDMVKAILDGRKTQTRRVSGKGMHIINANPDIWKLATDFPQGMEYRGTFQYQWEAPNMVCTVNCPYGQVGDRLWLRHRYDLFDVYYKLIPGWNDNYAAGTDGHIYRMDGSEPYQLKECSTGNGYLGISLSQGSYKQTINVHRLICQAFYGEDDHQRSQARHLDGNSLNNHPSNLDWGTQEDNWLDRKYHGRGMGEQHHNSKLTVQQVLDIRLSKKSQRQLAFQYGVSQPTIQDVLVNKTWKYGYEQPHRNYPEWHGWKSPLFMPRWASRITLEITEVRVERLDDMKWEDAWDEGISWSLSNNTAMAEYIRLWDSLNAKRGFGWSMNPWCWKITFKKEE